MPIVEYSEDYNRRSMTQANTKRGTITSDINNTERENKTTSRRRERKTNASNRKCKKKNCYKRYLKQRERRKILRDIRLI